MNEPLPPEPPLALMPDVNLFLQCRAIESLPWKEVVAADAVTVYIGRKIQEEIDNLKGDGNQRRARRARETNGFFRRLLKAPNRTLTLNEASPRVEITFLPRLDPTRVRPPLLDPSKPDDCIIEEALAFRAGHPEFRTAILTHDTNPMLTAHEVGMNYLAIPDSWLLEPENDERQKQFDDLTRQVKVLQQQFPQLSVSCVDVAGAHLNALAFLVREYAAPSPTQIDALKIALRERPPLQEVFEEPFADEHWSRLAAYSVFQQFQPPDQREIEKYQRAYEIWLAATDDFLQTLPERLSARSAVAEVTFRLANTGTEAAKSLLVEFRATPGFLIRPPYGEDRSGSQDRETRLPQVPEPPRGRYVDRFASLAAAIGLPGAAPPLAHAALTASFMPPQTNRDLDAFYYRDRPRHFVDSVSLDCSLFRQQLEPKPFAFEVQWQGDKQRTRGAIHCRVSAEKLPELVEFVLPVSVAIEQDDISSEIERFRPKPPRLLFGRKRSKSADSSGA